MKELTMHQNGVIKSWEAICGAEFMHIDEVLSGAMTFRDAWNANVRWAENVLASLSNLYKGDREEDEETYRREEAVKDEPCLPPSLLGEVVLCTPQRRAETPRMCGVCGRNQSKDGEK